MNRLIGNQKLKFLLLILLVIVSSLTGAQVIAQQAKRITGTLMDASNQEPMIGVTVIVKGTTTGTTTDVKGKYSIEVANANAILTFSSVGYVSQNITVGNQSVIDVQMVSDVQALSEVVVVGYGTQTRKTMTGAVSSVKAKDLNTVNTVSVDNILQGKFSGVSVTQNSAQAGSGMDINIRGALSPRGNNSPLYVIDGVAITQPGNPGGAHLTQTGDPGDQNGLDVSPLAMLNPSDIESIDVLKDASSTAIYGSAAANGVILITTKRGKEGKATITYDGSYSFQDLSKYWKPLAAKDFMKQSNRAEHDYWLLENNIAPYGTTDPSTVSAFIPKFTDQEIAAAKNYDHVKDIMKTGHIIDQNLSISGGTSKTKYFVSFNYFRNDPIIIESNFKKYVGRINFDQEITKWLKFSMNSMYTQIDTKNPSTGRAGNSANVAQLSSSAVLFPSSLPLWKDDTHTMLNTALDGVTPNPFGWIYRKDNTKSSRLFFAPNLEVKIFNDLKANIVAGYDKTSAFVDQFIPNISARAYGFVPGILNNYGGNSYDENINSSVETYLTYTKTFNTIHKLSVVAGAGYYKSSDQWFSVELSNYPSDALQNYNNALNTNRLKDVLKSDRVEHTKISQFGRLNYILKDRYIVGFTIRNDGSSSFPADKKYGLFPGLSGAWVISEEGFLKNNSVLSNLKLRAGWGTSGNESVVVNNNYYLDTYVPVFPDAIIIGGAPITMIEQNNLKNSELKWETDIQENIGLDFGLFKDRLNGSIEVYRRTAKDLLDWAPGFYTDPVGGIWKNVGSTQSNGVEVSLQGIVVKSNDFEWNANLTFSYNKSSWLERNPEVPLNPWVGAKDELGAIYGWKTDGIFKTLDEVANYKSNSIVLQPKALPGNLKYVDINGDGVLDLKDIVYLGSYAPKYNFGFSTSFRYRPFDLNIVTYGNAGGYNFDANGTYASLGSMRNRTNQTYSVEEVWTADNPNGTRPGLAPDQTAQNNSSGGTDFGLYKMYFLRLSSVNLGYSIPQSLLQKINVGKARVYCDVKNLGVLTNYKGLDPEMERGSASTYPLSTTVAFGLNVTF
jgi:TonB-linked SusC/RagA family outer membrane protein